MAASLKQDYAKILKARADLVMISPDSIETHRKYALTLFREELPYLYVSDSNLDIARRSPAIKKLPSEYIRAGNIYVSCEAPCGRTDAADYREIHYPNAECRVRTGKCSVPT